MLKCNHTVLIFVFLLAFLGTNCVSVPMPQIEIPQNRNEFNGAIMLGNNGLSLSSAYSPDARWFFNLAGNVKASPFAPISLSVEGGMGWVNPSKVWMTSINYGGGHFLLKPSLSGSSDALKNVEGDFSKVSLTINFLFDPHTGFIGRVSRSWISAFAEYNRPEYSYAETFKIGLGAEGMFYFYATKKRNLLIAVGSAYSFNSTASRGMKENVIYPTIAYLAIGYRLRKHQD